MRNLSGILWGLIFIVVGALMLLDRFHYLYFDFGDFIRTWWPLALVIVGLGILFDRYHGREGHSKTGRS